MTNASTAPLPVVDRSSFQAVEKMDGQVTGCETGVFPFLTRFFPVSLPQLPFLPGFSPILNLLSHASQLLLTRVSRSQKEVLDLGVDIRVVMMTAQCAAFLYQHDDVNSIAPLSRFSRFSRFSPASPVPFTFLHRFNRYSTVSHTDLPSDMPPHSF